MCICVRETEGDRGGREGEEREGERGGEGMYQDSMEELFLNFRAIIVKQWSVGCVVRQILGIIAVPGL